MAVNTSGVVAGDALWIIKGEDKELKRALDGAEKSVKSSFANMTRVAGVAMTAVGGAITGAMGLAVKSAMSFGNGMAKIATLGVNDLETLSDSVRDVARAYGLDLVDATEAGYQALSAGEDEMRVPELLEKAAIAATAGMTGLTTAVVLGASTANAFGQELSTVNTIYDQAFTAVDMGLTTFEELASTIGKLSPVMSAAGLETDEMFASITALTAGGIATSEAVTGLKGIMAGIIKPTSEAQEMAKVLGIEFNSTALEAKGLHGFLGDVAVATGGNIDQMGQLFTSQEGLTAALALTGNSAGLFTDALKRMRTEQGATQEAFDQFVANSPTYAWGLLKAEMIDLAITVGESLLPVLKRVVDFGGPIVRWIGEFARENAGLTAGITIATTAIGGLMFVLGPFLITLPGLVTAFGLLAGPAAIGGVGVAATAAGIGIGGLALAIAPFVIAATAATIAGVAITKGMFEAEMAERQLEESTKRLTATSERYTEQLRSRGIVVDEAAMSEMNLAEQTAYRADLEKEAADGMLRAWIEHYAGRTETEQEFARARNLLLNEFLTEQEAALIATSDLSDEMVTKFVTATETETQVMLEVFGIGAQAALETNEVITQSSLDAASDRESAWIDSTHNIIAEEARAAQEAQSIWSSAWDWIRGLWGGGPQPPMPPAQPQGFAVGGVVGADSQAFRMNERGGEIAIAPVGTRILSHGESVSVARDAITAAMSGMGGTAGGGGRSVNIEMNVSSLVVREEADIGRISRALGDEISRRAQTSGVR